MLARKLGYWRMQVIFIAIAAAISIANVFTAQAEERDWVFTRDDYTKLVRKGGALRFASDSAWLPAEYQRNLLAVLNYALDEKLKPTSTNAVSLSDFYHGHIACDGNIEGLNVSGALLYESYDRQGLDYYMAPPPNKLKEYVDSVVRTERRVGGRLRRMIDTGSCKRLLVLYHTFEGGWDRITPGDPRRNLLLRLDADKVEHYSPPNPGNATSWTDEFVEITQLAFLVDEEGVVHATIGSTTQLEGRVMGRMPSR